MDGHGFRLRGQAFGWKPTGLVPGSGLLLFSLVASGQVKLRRIDDCKKISAALSEHTVVAA